MTGAEEQRVDPEALVEALDGALAAAVERAAPAVVRVDAGCGAVGSGTGWGDGLVVTSRALIDGRDQVEVGLASGETVDAELVGDDPGTDLAVIRVAGAPAIESRAVDDLRVGQLTLALGRPGRSVRASLRIVGVLGPAVRSPAGGRIDCYVETDRGLPPGFPGGPLIDLRGRAIGIDTRSLIRGADLAVPAVTVDRVVAEIVAHGTVRHGYLGVGVYGVDLPRPIREARQQARGVVVVGIDEGSPADQAGLLVGDILVELGDDRIDSPEALRALLFDRAHQATRLVLVRAGQSSEVEVAIGARG